MKLEINQADSDDTFVDSLAHLIHHNRHAGFIKEHVFLQEAEVMIFRRTSAALIAALRARHELSTRYNCATSAKIV